MVVESICTPAVATTLTALYGLVLGYLLGVVAHRLDAFGGRSS